MPAPKGHPPYNKNGEGGVPKKYTPDFIEKEAVALEKWLQDDNNIFLKRFAYSRGYSHDRLAEWAEINERFQRAYNLLKEWQEIKLAEGGLTAAFNPGFSKFLLQANCGYRENGEKESSTTNVFIDGVKMGMGKSSNLVEND